MARGSIRGMNQVAVRNMHTRMDAQYEALAAYTQEERERAWRAFVNVRPLLSLGWWDMATFWARFEVASVFWRSLADRLEDMAAEKRALDAEDADWQAAMRERADLLAGL